MNTGQLPSYWSREAAEALETATDEDIREAATRIANHLINHPLALRYIQRSWSTGDNRIRSAADVMGERMVRVAGTLYTVIEKPTLLRTNITDNDLSLQVITHLAPAIAAPAYLWTEKVRAAMREASTLKNGEPAIPDCVISRKILPQPRMWWTFETGIGIGKFEDGKNMTVDAIYVAETLDGIGTFALGTAHKGEEPGPDRDEEPALIYRHLKYGMRYPDGFNGDGRTDAGALLAFCAFLNSPFVARDQTRLLRPERREMQRLGSSVPDEHVTFVTLRRPTISRKSDDPSAGRDWKHQWIVQGHYRAQWYPSEQAHHVIWIAPHLKGPEDAPLLEHVYRVAR